MTALVLQFSFLSLVIVVAGSFLAKYADKIAEQIGMGRSMAGLLLLAIATSLPELTVGCHAALLPAPDLAVGDVLGSCLFNLLILAVLDLTNREVGRMLSKRAAAHALSATVSVLLTAIFLLSILVDVPWTLGNLSVGSVVIGIAYLLGLRLIYLDQQVSLVAADQVVLGKKTSSLRRDIVGYLTATIVIFVAAPKLAQSADQLSEISGLGGTFVGTIFVALVTSLPEVTTTRAAIRMGAYDMAVGNILGSNSFNIVALLGIDFFYQGPLLASSSLSAAHAVTAAAVIVVTAVATMGLLYRAEKRFWVVEPDAVLVILLVIGALVLVYFA